MSTQATFADFYKTSTTPGTAVALGLSTVTFNKLTLSGYKSAGTANTGSVYYRPVDGTGWITLPSGADAVVPIPEGCFLRASQIEIDVDTSGDGVYAQYVSAVVYEGA